MLADCVWCVLAVATLSQEVNAQTENRGSSKAEHDAATKSLEQLPIDAPEEYREMLKSFLAGEQRKIIGGKPVEPGTRKYQVSLAYPNIANPASAHFCGGAIIAERWVVTAAHCVWKLNPNAFNLVVGSTKLKAGLPRTAVTTVYVHPNYNPLSRSYDLALLQVSSSLLSAGGILIKWVEDTDSEKRLTQGKKLEVTGWGAISGGGGQVSQLRAVAVPFVDFETCKNIRAYGDALTRDMMCAGEYGRDGCQGDSGGPLTSAGNLVGIVSWGDGCAIRGRVGVYARIASASNWLQSCLSTSENCASRLRKSNP